MTEPLSPPDCDLRGYDFMPLFGHRLFSSTFNDRASAEEFRAAIRLWWASWQQCPAGSLPNDDAALARLADFGRDLKGWAKVRTLALHGFIECSDGRLYHPLICQEAQAAFERRKRDRQRKAAQREARKGGNDPGTGGGNPEDVPRDNPRTETGTSERHPQEFHSDRTEQDRTERTSSLRSDAAAPATAAVDPPDPVDARTELWREGIPILRRLIGKSDGQTRSLLGRMLQQIHDDCALLLAVLHDAEDARPADPVAWLQGAIRERTRPKTTLTGELAREWSLPSFADPAALAAMEEHDQSTPRLLQ